MFLLLVDVSGVAGQQITAFSDDIYGSDPDLCNGRLYIFYVPSNTGGNQFFTDPQFETGSVTIRGIIYKDLMLNYDIYNQQLILKYGIKTGVVCKLIVSDAWLESFNFKGLDFKMIATQDTLKQIFQVIGTGPKHILYHWKKTLEPESTFGATNLAFSIARKEMNMFTDNRILAYRNNKSFYSLFDPEKRIAVKDYLRKHQINIKKATDQLMTELINYCNTLISLVKQEFYSYYYFNSDLLYRLRYWKK